MTYRHGYEVYFHSDSDEDLSDVITDAIALAVATRSPIEVSNIDIEDVES